MRASNTFILFLVASVYQVYTIRKFLQKQRTQSALLMGFICQTFLSYKMANSIYVSNKQMIEVHQKYFARYSDMELQDKMISMIKMKQRKSIPVPPPAP